MLVLLALCGFVMISAVVWWIGHEEMYEIHTSQHDSSLLRFVLWDALILTTSLVIGSVISVHIYLIGLPRNEEMIFYMDRNKMGIRLIWLMLMLEIAMIAIVVVIFELELTDHSEWGIKFKHIVVCLLSLLETVCMLVYARSRLSDLISLEIKNK